VRRKHTKSKTAFANTTCDGPDDAGSTILHESPGDDLQGIGDGEVGVALVDGECLCLFAEERRQHHFGRTAAGEEFGVEDMITMLQCAILSGK
jgi:hypothetical protein